MNYNYIYTKETIHQIYDDVLDSKIGINDDILNTSDSYNGMGETLISLAVKFYPEIVDRVLKLNPDLEIPDSNPDSGWTPIMGATLKCRLNIVKKLVDAGANYNYVSHNGHNAHYIAIDANYEGSHDEIIQYLEQLDKKD